MDAIGNGIDLQDNTSIANIGMIYPETNVESIVSYNNANKITKIENQPYSNIPRGNYRSVINEYISQPVDFTNGVGTFNIDLADYGANNLLSINGIPFGSGESFSMGITNISGTVYTFTVRCTSDSSFSLNGLSFRIHLVCNNPLPW